MVAIIFVLQKLNLGFTNIKIVFIINDKSFCVHLYL